jgi:hypothetical protein
VRERGELFERMMTNDMAKYYNNDDLVSKNACDSELTKLFAFSCQVLIRISHPESDSDTVGRSIELSPRKFCEKSQKVDSTHPPTDDDTTCLCITTRNSYYNMSGGPETHREFPLPAERPGATWVPSRKRPSRIPATTRGMNTAAAATDATMTALVVATSSQNARASRGFVRRVFDSIWGQKYGILIGAIGTTFLCILVYRKFVLPVCILCVLCVCFDCLGRPMESDLKSCMCVSALMIL